MLAEIFLLRPAGPGPRLDRRLQLRWPDRDLDDSNQNQIPNVRFGSDSVIRRCRLAALIAVLRALVEAEASQDRGPAA